ncbi:NADP-dependent phosphogluconate dehydrogenase [Tuanshanicoccus lijuaniae]|uniref:NADP-dependent phosphogluconate dehydrogenase n=1 Tax=Aerococcaceae bacterium zg-1292 TaxID=2774330 RepID=UPI001BD8FFF2|nr:NADP-dependent phosphogluconate dehydrogenase [Aerococcaceae bacterium zg-A91]MBS4458413.1 NADP-dependent phosphogluconate dehydrogenase [Aerococcaceae bacterium zg-BR33]
MKNIVIGLGKMGLNLVKNLNRNNEYVYGYDIDLKRVNGYTDDNFVLVEKFEHLFEAEKQHLVMLLLPSGAVTNQMISSLVNYLAAGDIVIDFSNSYFKTSQQNAKVLEKNGIKYMDCGLSGGMSGALNGACMMLGNSTDEDIKIHKLLRKLCVTDGFEFYEKVGSGHYLKMVHNGIEYGMMQSIAEGLQLLSSQNNYSYNLATVTKNWAHGSIISSSLMNNIFQELNKDVSLKEFSEKVYASGEANWMVKEAIDSSVPVPVIYQALNERNSTHIQDKLGHRALSAMRYNFGGHNESEAIHH